MVIDIIRDVLPLPQIGEKGLEFQLPCKSVSPDDLGPKEKSFQFPSGIPNPPPLQPPPGPLSPSPNMSVVSKNNIHIEEGDLSGVL